MLGCCCKQQETHQPVEVTQVVQSLGSNGDSPAEGDASPNSQMPPISYQKTISIQRTMSSKKTMTSKASERLKMMLSEPEIVTPSKQQDEDQPMESMPFVRQMSSKLTGQLGIDLDSFYASDDPEVLAADEDMFVGTTLSHQELLDAVKNVLDAAEDLLPKRTMTDYQRSWCTSKTVKIYLDSRNGDVGKAAESLALAIIWRESNKDVLQGNRIPKWQGDMRVLTRSAAGHPMVYICMANQVRFPSVKGNMEHMGVVLNKALEAMQGDAMTFDWIFDCHGFRISSNLDPRPTVGLMEMLKHPFRERLRAAWVVDAPAAFSLVWNIAYPHMPVKTREKIKFVKQEQALEMVAITSGLDVANAVRDVMAANRARQTVNVNLPSELSD